MLRIRNTKYFRAFLTSFLAVIGACSFHVSENRAFAISENPVKNISNNLDVSVNSVDSKNFEVKNQAQVQGFGENSSSAETSSKSVPDLGKVVNQEQPKSSDLLQNIENDADETEDDYIGLDSGEIMSDKSIEDLKKGLAGPAKDGLSDPSKAVGDEIKGSSVEKETVLNKLVSDNDNWSQVSTSNSSNFSLQDSSVSSNDTFDGLKKSDLKQSGELINGSAGNLGSLLSTPKLLNEANKGLQSDIKNMFGDVFGKCCDEGELNRVVGDLVAKIKSNPELRDRFIGCLPVDFSMMPLNYNSYPGFSNGSDGDGGRLLQMFRSNGLCVGLDLVDSSSENNFVDKLIDGHKRGLFFDAEIVSKGSGKVVFSTDCMQILYGNDKKEFSDAERSSLKKFYTELLKQLHVDERSEEDFDRFMDAAKHTRIVRLRPSLPVSNFDLSGDNLFGNAILNNESYVINFIDRGSKRNILSLDFKMPESTLFFGSLLAFKR